MATKSKSKSKSKKVAQSKPTARSAGGGGAPNDPYVRLRTMLDSLEIGAIRYYLMATGSSGKTQRYNELSEALMPIINWLWHVPDVDCPEGYVDCHGCCVPYPCPD